jgi:hypothetical protein
LNAFLPYLHFCPELKNPRGQGDIVSKKHGFLPDTAIPKPQLDLPRLMNDLAGVLRFFITLRGNNLTVHPPSDEFFVPYFGRGFWSKDKANVFLDFAKHKNLQHTRLWKNLQIIWQNEHRYAMRGLDAAQRARNKVAADALVQEA